MNRTEKSNTGHSRMNRVVSLPCGHHVHVDNDASLLAVSGPVLDHQATCRPERPPTFAAWYTVGPLSKGEPDSVGDHHPAPWRYGV
jgi:hypothetical protein